MLVEWSQLVLPSVFCAVAMRVDEPITVRVVNEVYRRTPKDLADKARWLGEFMQDVIEREGVQYASSAPRRPRCTMARVSA